MLKKSLIKVSVYLLNTFKKGVKSIVVKDNLIIVWLDKKYLNLFVDYIKNNSSLRVDSLLDIWGVDYLERKERFEVNYLLVSVRNNIRINVKVSVGVEEEIETMTEIYPGAGWLEREVWDMYGVYFEGNKDLRRILTDYGFEGHPLRKDFPLSGYVEVRYEDGEKRVVLEPIELTQEFRNYDFISPWEKRREEK